MEKNKIRNEVLEKVKYALKSVRNTDYDKNYSLSFSNNLLKSKTDDISKFKLNLEKVNGNVIEVNDVIDIIDHISNILKINNFTKFSISNSNNLIKLGIKSHLLEEGLTLIDAYNKIELAESEVGITEANYAISDTGTIVLFAGSDNPRSISLVTPVHIAILNSNYIVSNIFNLFKIFNDINLLKSIPSCITFITGPSRTADIELKLILGVHGPKELYVLVY